jgi:formaldehyde-activating enzyme involved in methanogenesis
MLTSLPVAIAEELDASAVNGQVQGSVSMAVGDLNCQGLLPRSQNGIVEHGPPPPVSAG